MTLPSLTPRDRMVVVIGAVVAIIVAFWLLAITPRRDQADQLGTQVDQAQAQLDSARSTLASEQAAKASFRRSYAELTRLGEAVPADDDVPSLLYQIQNAASEAGVSFSTIQLAPANSGAASSPSSTPLPPGAAVGPAGFPIENFTFNFSGNFFRLSNFFERLQRLVSDQGTFLTVSGRLLTLNSITLQQAGSGFPQISASVAATAYIVPAAQGLLNGATAAGPATPASSTSTSGNPSATTASATPAPGASAPTPAPAATTSTTATTSTPTGSTTSTTSTTR